MALTRVQIISQALTLLGKKPIINLQNQSDIVSAADAAFDPLAQATMSEGFWRFSSTIVELSQSVIAQIIPSQGIPTPIVGFNAGANTLQANNHGLTIGIPNLITFTATNLLPQTNPQIALGTYYYALATDANNFQVYTTAAQATARVNVYTIASAGNAANVVNLAVAQNLAINVPIGGYWLYAYALPGDYLKLIHLWPQQYDFEIYNNNMLYTNYNNLNQPLFLEYQFYALVQNWPAYFCKYFAYELAAYLALSNAQRPDYYQELDRKKTIELAIAQAADAQNRPQTPLQSAPMLTRRYVSAFASG